MKRLKPGLSIPTLLFLVAACNGDGSLSSQTFPGETLPPPSTDAAIYFECTWPSAGGLDAVLTGCTRPLNPYGLAGNYPSVLTFQVETSAVADCSFSTPNYAVAYGQYHNGETGWAFVRADNGDQTIFGGPHPDIPELSVGDTVFVVSEICILHEWGSDDETHGDEWSSANDPFGVTYGHAAGSWRFEIRAEGGTAYCSNGGSHELADGRTYVVGYGAVRRTNNAYDIVARVVDPETGQVIADETTMTSSCWNGQSTTLADTNPRPGQPSDFSTDLRRVRWGINGIVGLNESNDERPHAAYGRLRICNGWCGG